MSVCDACLVHFPVVDEKKVDDRHRPPRRIDPKQGSKYEHDHVRIFQAQSSLGGPLAIVVVRVVV